MEASPQTRFSYGYFKNESLVERKMKDIRIGEEVYALLSPLKDLKEGTEWFGEKIESLQASRMSYPTGKSFRVHYHIMNPRTIKRTQEAFIVISGRIAVDVYNKADLLGTLEGEAGDIILVYRGGHGVRILEDAVVYEVKAGQYTSVSEDKEFLDV